MSAIISFFTGKIAGPIFGAASLALLVLLATAQLRFMDMRGQRDDLQAELLQKAQQLAQAQTNVAQLQSDLDTQNIAVAALEARTVAAEQAKADALADAEQARSDARDRLAAARAIPAGETMCETATLRGAQFLFGGIQ